MKYNIKIYSDFTCPFCYLGKGIIRELKKNFIIEDQWISYQMNPELPDEGMSLSDYFKGFEVKNLLSPLIERAKYFKLPFKDLDYIYNTSLALQAAEYAREKGKYEEFSFKVFKEYFGTQGNISSTEVLGRIGDSIGLDSKEMIKKLNEGAYMEKLEENNKLAASENVNSIPTFIINDDYRLSGAQPLEVFEGLLLEIYENKVFNNKNS